MALYDIKLDPAGLAWTRRNWDISKLTSRLFNSDTLKRIKQQDISSVLFKLPDETLAVIEHSIRLRDSDNHLKNIIISALNLGSEPKVIDDIITLYLNLGEKQRGSLNVFTEWFELKACQGYWIIMETLNGVSAAKHTEYDIAGNQPLRFCSEETFSKVLGYHRLLDVVSDLNETVVADYLLYKDGTPSFTDPRIPQLIVDHYAEMDKIADFIKERETVDYELLSMMLTGTTPTSVGVL